MYLQKEISRKNSFLLAYCRSRTKIAESGAGSGSIGQRIRIRTKISVINNTVVKWGSQLQIVMAI
jgi:hypothetical protein